MVSYDLARMRSRNSTNGSHPGRRFSVLGQPSFRRYGLRNSTALRATAVSAISFTSHKTYARWTDRAKMPSSLALEELMLGGGSLLDRGLLYRLGKNLPEITALFAGSFGNGFGERRCRDQLLGPCDALQDALGDGGRDGVTLGATGEKRIRTTIKTYQSSDRKRLATHQQLAVFGYLQPVQLNNDRRSVCASHFARFWPKHSLCGTLPCRRLGPYCGSRSGVLGLRRDGSAENNESCTQEHDNDSEPQPHIAMS